MKLLISKRKEMINVCTVNSLKAKMEKSSLVVPLLNSDKRQQSQYFQKQFL